MKYNFSEDLKSIREILGFSQKELAEKLGVEQVTVSRNELEKTKPSARFLESVYSFAFAKKIKMNKLKEMLWRDDLGINEKLLFHGAKSEIEGKIDIHRGRKNNDFGQGFYTGESYEQAISFVSGFANSSVYYLSFNDKNLKCKQYDVNQDWMIRILLCAQENGFVANGDYDLFDWITTDKQLDDAIVLAKVLLEKAADMAGE